MLQRPAHVFITYLPVSDCRRDSRLRVADRILSIPARSALWAALTIVLSVAGGACALRSAPPVQVATAPNSIDKPAIAARPIEVTPIQTPLDPALLSPQASEFVLGVQDELRISVYGYPDMEVLQSIRPDGNVAFPLAGTLRASGLTPEALQDALTTRLAQFIREPHVTVVVTAYHSRRAMSIGELNTPGLIPVSSAISLLEGIARAGGLTDEADLSGAMLVRDGKVLPISFERLLRGGDLSQNVMLVPNDILLVPHVAAKKIFVLGEVREPQVVMSRFSVSLIEAITLAGGVSRAAQSKNILIIRGGLAKPELLMVNLRDLAEKGDASQNIGLVPGDIVYVPRSTFANVVEFFGQIRDIVSPILLIETLSNTSRPIAFPQ